MSFYYYTAVYGIKLQVSENLLSSLFSEGVAYSNRLFAAGSAF
mgnify:CR=1 FL=1